MAKRTVVGTDADPTLSTTEIKIKGKLYTLCFDLGALAEAEAHFRRAGVSVNLLNALPEVCLSSVLINFPCAAHRFHPELSFEDAQAVIRGSLKVIYALGPFIAQAWQDALPDVEADAPKTTATPHQP